jgi:hypothetical protein
MGLKGYRLWAMGQLDSTCRAPPLRAPAGIGDTVQPPCAAAAAAACAAPRVVALQVVYLKGKL